MMTMKCPQCGQEYEGAGTHCPACANAVPAAAPLVVTPPAGLSAPATIALVAINFAVFLYMLAHGSPLMHPTAADILHFGASFGPLTLGSQWWRMVTAMFVHIGLVHLLINQWCLWDLGFMAEQLYGPWTLLAVYLLSGVSGSLVSVAYNPAAVSAGASGAIFGIAGALITTLHFGHIPAPRKALRASLISLLVFAGFNLAYGFQKGGIDNGAHIGGFVAGLLLGAVMSREFRPAAGESRATHRWVLAVFALVVFGATLGVRHFAAPMVELAHVDNLLAKGDTKTAVAQLQTILKNHPKNSAAWTTLANAYLNLKQPADAEAAAKKAVAADPKNYAGMQLLSAIYLSTNRFQDAADVLQRLSQANPKDVSAYVNRGVALNRLDKFGEAVASFKQALAIDPKQPVAWYNLGLSNMALKRYDDAIAAFQQVTKLVPNDPEPWIWLSNAYQQKGMDHEANVAYAKGYTLRMQRIQQVQQQMRQQQGQQRQQP